MTKPQSQASLIEQLKALIPVANREGLYDAADFLRAKVEAQEAREKVVDNFLTHVTERRPMYDATHQAEEGDDSHYYELDARVVEPLVKALIEPRVRADKKAEEASLDDWYQKHIAREGAMGIQMGGDDIPDDDRPMGVSLRDD